jgi:hypothetical protein
MLAPPCVSDELKRPISFGLFRMSPAVVLPIVRVGPKPFVVASLLVGPIFPVRFHLEPLPFGFFSLPALRFFAVPLVFVSRTRWEVHATIKTGNRLHTTTPPMQIKKRRNQRNETEQKEL